MGDETPITRPSTIVSRDTMKPSAPERTHDFLYKESKRAKLEREKEERRRKREVEIEFAPEDLALATVPGADFDPSARALTWRSFDPSRSSGRERSNLSPRRRKTKSTGSQEPRTQLQQEGPEKQGG